MTQRFATFKEAKKAFKEKTGVDFGSPTLSPIKIFDRRKEKWRSKAQKKSLKNPFFVGTNFEWLNL